MQPRAKNKSSAHVSPDLESTEVIFEQSPISTQMFALDGTLIRVNKAWRKLWGAALKDVHGYNIFEDQQLQDQGVMPLIKKAFSGKIIHFPPVRYEPNKVIAHVSKVSYRWTKELMYPVKDKKGKVQLVVLQHEDITGQMTAQQKLQENNVILQAVVEGTTDAVYVKDRNGRYLLMNSAGARFVGYNVNNIIGRTSKEIMQTDTAENFTRNDRKVMQSKKALMFEEQIMTGTVLRTFSAAKAPLLDGSGKVIGVIGISRDITERKKEQEDIRQAKEQLEIILKNIADGILVQNSDGAIIYGNIVAARAMGYASSEALLSMTHHAYENKFAMFDQFGNPFPVANLPGRRALLGEKNPCVTIKYIDRQTGRIHWAVIKATAIGRQRGKPELVVTVISDITEIKKLEQQKDEFLGIASHELKTPVTSLKAFAQVLQRRFIKEGNEQSAMLLAKMDSQINKLISLIQDLLDISKIEGGRLQFHDDTFSFDDLVYDIAEEVQRTTENHVIKMQGSTGITLYADRERIGQVIINFLTNAIKYSPDKKNIIIHTLVTDKEVELYVEDFGVGIAQENITHVFERFYRVSGKANETISGMGLGLHISREIIKRHKGRIWVKSMLNKGSTFCFAIPIRKHK